jgi:tRNA modification GTPase
VIAADDADAERSDVDAVIWTKADVAGAPAGRFAVSARTGLGLDALRMKLEAIAFGTDSDAPAGTVALNARHVAAVERSREALRAARASVGRGGEFIAGELRHALDRLGDVGGAVTPDDVLGKIFGSFCIGK